MDLKKYIQEQLDIIAPNRYKVSDERVLKSYFEGEVVVSALVGSANKYNESRTYQLDVITANINETIDELKDFATKLSQTSFEDTTTDEQGNMEIDFITQTWSTPVVSEKDIQVGSNHYTRITLFGNLFILKNASNVKKIEIDGENIDFENGTLAWSQTTFSNRVSERSNNKNVSEASSSALTFVMKSQVGQFANKLRNLRTGAIHRNTGFNVVITMSDDSTETYTMIVNQYQYQFNKSGTPSITIGLIEKEDFTGVIIE